MGVNLSAGSYCQDLPFPPTTGQYIRLRALSEINGNPFTAVAEVNVIGVPATPPPPTVAKPQCLEPTFHLEKKGLGLAITNKRIKHTHPL
jgi:hypothetical protein